MKVGDGAGYKGSNALITANQCEHSLLFKSSQNRYAAFNNFA